MKSRRSSSYAGGAVVAGGIHSLGIGLTQCSNLLNTTFFDLFDVHNQFWVHFGNDKNTSNEDDSSTLSALSIVSVGMGVLMMAGGQAIGRVAPLNRGP